MIRDNVVETVASLGVEFILESLGPAPEDEEAGEDHGEP